MKKAEKQRDTVSSAAEIPAIEIKPGKGWRHIDVRELLQYRELFYLLIARDLKVRYKQTILGGLWAIIQPLFSMVIFTLFFGKLAKVPSDGVPYPIFNFTAMVVWTYFSYAVSTAGGSLVSSSALMSKIYFPRIFIPLTPIVVGLLDFFIGLVFLFGMMAVYHIQLSARLLWTPLLMIILVLTVSGIGMYLAALNSKYRDVRIAIPFLLQLWMFGSPIVYPASLVPAKYQSLYALNPMVGIVEGFRSALLHTRDFPATLVLMSAIVAAVVFILGLQYFKQTERYIADII